MWNKKRTIFLLGLLSGFWFPGTFSMVFAQNAPVTTATTVVNAVPGTQVTVPVTVTGFTNIGSFTLHLNYDYSKLHFVQGNLNPLLVNTLAVGEINLGNGFHQIILGWYSAAGASVPNGTWIVNLVFTYLSGNSTLEWYDSGPSCLYTDSQNTTLNDSPTSTYYINGMVCGAQGTPGQISGSSSVCQGTPSVSYSIDPLQNVSGYLWSVPPGASIISGGNTNSIIVNYSLNSSSGNVTVNGINECGLSPASALPVTVNSLPVANAGNDTTVGFGSSIYLHAANPGQGSYTYHWTPENLLINPNVQHPQTISLTTSAVFQVEITTIGSTCSANDQKAVIIAGGALSINPVVVPGNICRNLFAQLFANAGGGTGSYNYSWTCVPPGNPVWTSNLANPVVNPDVTTQYFLTVTDGFASSSGSTTLLVNQLPTAIISGGDTLCDDGSVTELRIDLTGVPPWSFIYTNGINSTTVNDQMISPYLFSTSDPGVYTLLNVNDENCNGTATGAATVIVNPVPSSPTITLSGTTLISDAPSGNQWYRNSVLIPGASAQTYTPVENGIYYDIVTWNGCSSDSSNNIDVTVTNLEKHMGSAYQIFPNPAKDYFIIRSSAPVDKDMKLTFFSNDGIPIRECEVNAELKQNEFLIDIRNLSPGFYFLMIYNGDKGVIQKLVIL